MKFYAASVIFTLLFSSNVFPQIEWRINSEAGLFKSSGYGILQEESFITRLDGFFKYFYEEDKRNLSLSLRVRPEYYGSTEPVNSIKAKIEGDYFQVENNFNWGINVSRQKNFLNDILFDFTYDVFSIVGDANWFYFGNSTLNTKAGYAYQTIEGNEKYKLDLFFADLKLITPVSSNFKLGYGFYAERFFIQNEINNEELIKNENKGYRVGPQLNLNYIKDFIFNIDYRLLVHKSEFIKNFSYEHWIRAVAGKIFFDNWSAFLLVDYNTYYFKKAENYMEGITPLYTPLNLENRIYLKIAYEINETFEVYSKGGYFKDNLYEDTFSLEGWNALIGIEFGGGIL